MMYPPTLPDDVKARAFYAANGELGVLPEDAPAFLDACRSDGVEVLGWELWIVNHGWDIQGNRPVFANGVWSGGIPVNGSDLLAVIEGSGDASETERELEATDLKALVQAAWLPFVRVNFTLDG